MFQSFKILILGLFFLSACQEEKKLAVESNHLEAPAYSKVPGKLGLIHQMQGRWKDHKIKNAELLISGNKFVSYYDDEVTNRATIEVFKKCPKACRKKKGKKGIGYFIVHREGEQYCYSLDRLDGSILEYTFIKTVEENN